MSDGGVPALRRDPDYSQQVAKPDPADRFWRIYHKPHIKIAGEPCECFTCLVSHVLFTAIAQLWRGRGQMHPPTEIVSFPGAIDSLHSRHRLSDKLPNTIDSEFCLEVLEIHDSGGCRTELFPLIRGVSSPPLISR